VADPQVGEAPLEAAEIVRTTATNGVPLSVINSCGTPHSSIASSSRARIQTASLVGTARIPSRNRL
jgi:hypothetical protein